MCIICPIWSSEVDTTFPQSVLTHDDWCQIKSEVMTCPEKLALPTGSAGAGALLLASGWGIIAHTLNFRPLCLGETTNVVGAQRLLCMYLPCISPPKQGRGAKGRVISRAPQIREGNPVKHGLDQSAMHLPRWENIYGMAKSTFLAPFHFALLFGQG